MNGVTESLVIHELSPSASAAIDIHDQPAIGRLSRRLHLDHHKLKQLRNTFYKRQGSFAEALAELPDHQRDAFAAEVNFHALRLMSRHDSRIDGASKLLFSTCQNMLIESVVLRIDSGRRSLCISSQVGCAAKCAFCATGKMGIAQDLSVPEILDQVIQANQLLRGEGRSVRNVVFMGMGEPLHNEENIYEAIEVLRSPHCFNLSERHLLVSTVGIPDAMVRCVRRFPQVGMALSLHSARQEVRERLVPLARRYDVKCLRETALQVTSLQRRRLMIEYTLFEDINDAAEDAAALIDFCLNMPVHVNLIPYNPIDAAPELKGTTLEGRRRFAAILRESGLRVTQRYSLGADIAAACGQLVRRENRLIARSSHS